MDRWHSSISLDWRMLAVTAKKLENKNFFKGDFFDHPDITEEAVHKNDCTDTK